MSKQDHSEANNEQSLVEDLALSETEVDTIKGGVECGNNLKQIGLAIHSSNDGYR